MRPRKQERIHLAAAAAGLVQRLKLSAQDRTAQQQLMGLSDHTLRDIGVSRTDIRFIAVGILPRRD